MIPKQLFFIWIGDNKPNYVDFAINTFKEVNPDFKVDLIYYTINDINNINNKIIYNIYDIDVENCIKYILTNSKYQKNLEKYKNRKFCQKLCNILRLEIINKYGGIYLDCDTFPLKPFDDYILKTNYFHSYSYNRDSLLNRRSDCFFLGSSGNIYTEKFNDLGINYNTGTYNYLNDKQWINNRNLFFKCQLKYIHKEYSYIEHYCDYTWDPCNCKTPICKYDE